MTQAAKSLCEDFGRVSGTPAAITAEAPARGIIIGTCGTPVIDRLIEKGAIDGSALKDKYEKYLLTTVSDPAPGVDEALVIAGSDRRGTVYGIYELSEQMGVSPWYWWADVPVIRQNNVYIKPGVYTDGEPAVKYRGIFLNDEAPCLTGWVKNHYGSARYAPEVFAQRFGGYSHSLVHTLVEINGQRPAVVNDIEKPLVRGK